ADLIRFEADRARSWYATGLQLIPMLDRRSAACTGAMAGIYRRLLEHISARPQDALAERMSLPGREKALIAFTALSGIGRRRAGRLAAAGQSATGQSATGQSTGGQT
ncbi:MAG TPA: squalene/phytoene synthase family protein, partial [Streptosporangiaceae bacterium]|nr:squalene/phytoene synthase family protein [Streptosporangiaceae bacterium]